MSAEVKSDITSLSTQVSESNEDPNQSNDDYIWISSKDGEIGRGRSITTDTLSEGVHNIIILQKGKDDIEQQSGIGGHVLMHFGFAFLVDDAHVHFPCMQIDSAIKCVPLVVKSHDLASLFR